MTDINEKQIEDKSRLYWFFHNSKERIANRIRNWTKKHPILLGILIFLLIYFLVTGRSSIQPAFLFIRKYLALILLVVLVFFLFLRRFKKRTWKQNIPATIVLIVFLGLSWILGPGIHNYLGSYFHYSALNKVKMTEMPLTDNERIQPHNSIRTLINQEALNETEDASSPSFVRGKDGQFYFTACIGPSKKYKVQQLTKNMYEVLKIPANSPAPSFSKENRSDVDFEIGEHLLFSKETDNAVIKRFGIGQFFNCETAEPIYIENDTGKWVQVVPIVKWKGFFFPRPVFGGVYVIEQSDVDSGYFKRVFAGKGNYISPDEIKKHKYLVGQNLMPEKVVTFTAESFKFDKGFFAPMPGFHEGDIRIPHMPDDQNSMPYVTYFDIKNNPKLYNYFGLEPFEENKRGLSLSLFIPGDSDEEVFYIDHRSEKFIGSSAVSSKIRESKKNYDWSVNYPAESRPYVTDVDGTRRFFWLSTVVSKTGTDSTEFIGGSIPELCLTDAVFGRVIWVDQDSLVDSRAWSNQVAEQMKNYWK